MENVDLEAAQHSIAKLIKLETEILQFYNSIISGFPRFFIFLYSVILQESIFNRAIRQIALNRINLRFPYKQFMQGETSSREDNLELETPTPFPSPLESFFTEKTLKKTEMPINQLLVPTQTKTVTPKVTTEKELAKKPLNEPKEQVPISHIFKWQTQLATMVTPSLQSVYSAILEYQKEAFLTTHFANEPSALSLQSGSLIAPVTAEASVIEELKQQKTIAESPVEKVTKPFQTEEGKAQKEPSSLGPKIEQEPEELQSSKSYSTSLTSIIWQQQKPFLKIVQVLSQIQPALASNLNVPRSTYAQPPNVSLIQATMPSIQVSLLLNEITPSLTSWIYEGSEVLRSTGVPLSAVPIAASKSEKVVTETLTQPTSSPTAARPVVEKESVPEPSRLSILPTVLALAGASSLINQRLQNELTAMAKAAQINKRLVLTRPLSDALKMTSMLEASTEVPLTITEAIGHLLQNSQDNKALPSYQLRKKDRSYFWDKIQKTQEMAQLASSIQAITSEIPQSLAINSHLRVVVPTELPTLKTPAKRSAIDLSKPNIAEQQAPKAATVAPPSPKVSYENQSVTVKSDGSVEEDLRDLEKRISKIISEQLSRYYGSSNI